MLFLLVQNGIGFERGQKVKLCSAISSFGPVQKVLELVHEKKNKDAILHLSKNLFGPMEGQVKSLIHDKNEENFLAQFNSLILLT